MHPAIPAQPRNLWQAMTRPGYLLSAWPWRSIGYLVTGAVTGVAALVAIVTLAAAGGVLAVVLVGLPLLVGTALAGLPVARVERLRLRLVDLEPVPDQHRMPAAPGLWAWLVTRLRERTTWRELGYALLFAGLLWPVDVLVLTVALLFPVSMTATPLLMATVGDGHEAKVLKQWTVTSWPAAFGIAVLGLVLMGLCAYVLGVAAGARAALTRLLIASREGDLGARVVELARSRVRLVDAFEAERRRIERDLHDGAQQRLVALTMTLGLARLDAPPGPLAEQLAKAHDEAGKALAELRELIHGIHPQVLADYGLQAAVADAADRCAIPVDVSLELPGRLPQAVEAAAYFVVCEALANVDRHSGAGRAEVGGGHRDGRLFLEVRDDGRGGADAGSGSGLTGLADRVSVLDGRLALSSPPGGPTLLRVEIPCELTELAQPTDRPDRSDGSDGSDRALRVVLVEDSVLLRDGLIGLLSRYGHEVVAAVGDAEALLAAVDEHGPDIVVTDVRMPPGFQDEGLHAALRLRETRPTLPVLVLSQYVQRRYAADLLDSGDGTGVGYLLKDRVGQVEEFVDALLKVADGGTVVDPEVVRQLLRRRRDPLERLTPREREVLALIAEGRSNGAIARELVVSEAAVGKHISGILTKLDLPPADETHRRVLAVLTFLRA